MKIKTKAKNFIKLIGNRLSKESIPDENLEEVLKEAISSHDEGALKDELLANLNKYVSKLKRVIVPDKAKNGHGDVAMETEDVAPPVDLEGEDVQKHQHPYNLYAKHGKKINNNVISSLPEHEKQTVYRCYVSQRLSKIRRDDQLFELLEKCGSQDGEKAEKERFAWLRHFHCLCSLACGRNDPALLKRIMGVFHVKLSESADECLKSKKHKGLKKLQHEIQQFLMYAQFKSQQLTQPFSKPSYEDYVAAILSVYLDLMLVAARDEDEDDVSRDACQFTSLVMTLLVERPDCVIDVLLQQSEATTSDVTFLLPLIRRALEKPKDMSPEVYTKFVVAVHQMSTLYTQDVQDILQSAYEVAAPQDYLAWIGEKDAAILDEMPEYRKFRGTRITRFLLENAADDLRDRLLDIVTVPPEENSTPPDEMEVESTGMPLGVEATDAPMPANGIFFLDTAADSQTSQILQEKQAVAMVTDEVEAASCEAEQADVGAALEALVPLSEDEDLPEQVSDR